jgi:hypothetical protein
MSPKKRPPNWEDIKTRYVVNGEKPSDIAKDYSVSVQTIKNRASTEKWKYEAVQIGTEIRESTIEKRKAFAELAIDTYLYGLQVIAKKIAATDNPYRQDGDGLPDAFFLEVMKAARDSLKTMDAAEPPKQEAAQPVELSYTEWHSMDEDQKTIYLATGKLPEKPENDS